jgi:hypothetical protein
MQARYRRSGFGRFPDDTGFAGQALRTAVTPVHRRGSVTTGMNTASHKSYRYAAKTEVILELLERKQLVAGILRSL